jgi:hypothetical protein
MMGAKEFLACLHQVLATHLVVQGIGEVVIADRTHN